MPPKIKIVQEPTLKIPRGRKPKNILTDQLENVCNEIDQLKLIKAAVEPTESQVPPVEKSKPKGKAVVESTVESAKSKAVPVIEPSVESAKSKAVVEPTVESAKSKPKGKAVPVVEPTVESAKSKLTDKEVAVIEPTESAKSKPKGGVPVTKSVPVVEPTVESAKSKPIDKEVAVIEPTESAKSKPKGRVPVTKSVPVESAKSEIVESAKSKPNGKVVPVAKLPENQVPVIEETVSNQVIEETVSQKIPDIESTDKPVLNKNPRGKKSDFVDTQVSEPSTDIKLETKVVDNEDEYTLLKKEVSDLCQEIKEANKVCTNLEQKKKMLLTRLYKLGDENKKKADLFEFSNSSKVNIKPNNILNCNMLSNESDTSDSSDSDDSDSDSNSKLSKEINKMASIKKKLKDSDSESDSDSD